METKQEVSEAQPISAEDRKALEKMRAELKRNLKSHSKNDLIRMLSSTLVDLHFMRKAFIDMQAIVEEKIKSEVKEEVI